MQIRFACEHCHQLLAVGAHKIGQRVACPRCAQLLEVPDEQGAANLLAARRQARAVASGMPTHSTSGAEKQPSTAAVGTSEPPETDQLSEFVVYDNTELVYDAAAADETPGVFDATKVAVPRSVIYVQGVLLGVVALAAFTLGALMGSGTRPRGISHVEVKPCVLAGNVALGVPLAEGGTPDPGAVIVVVPDGRIADERKIAVTGMRPDDAAIDENHDGVKALRSLGGSYVRANADGAYRLVVPRPGKYRLLVISYAGTRTSDDVRFMEDLGQLTLYFREPNLLIGRNKYVWTTLTVLDDTQRELVVP